MRSILAKVAKPASVAALAIAALALAPVAGAAPAAPEAGATITAADINPAAGTFTTVSDGDLAIQGAGDGTPAGAVQWFKNRIGSTAYQGLCEKAVENAYGTTGVWASANAHWNGASPKHTTGTPPKGSFVYWNISQWGHVGIADGSGGIYASSIGGKIGHASSVHYFNNYRGWTPAAVPHR
ncbi:CHAP domain-containing protein [Amycolatopsis sp. WAC 01376]|uniref:CHAP domain-containing protein n=1 Tax=unclassified Amycolatopsis TaxID=2618356 RepID=UPI000F79CC8F|nr:CHAP domain-containing protein [Amycolatopsis sp. WAC 01376]RSM62859.1 CHAP domain-containing protein [Amycolatopsis sp. WAC 01376]